MIRQYDEEHYALQAAIAGQGLGWQFDPGFGKRRQRPAATLQSGYQCRRRRLQRAMRARTGTSSAGEGILRMAEAGGRQSGHACRLERDA